jgi:polyhydroxybutyrate depolymerase
MKLAYALLAFPLLGFSCAPATKVHIEPGRYVRTVKEGEVTRSYLLRVPKAYDNRTNLPLVILLHGWTSNKEQAEVYTEFGAKADKEGFVLITPDGTDGIGPRKGWNCGFLNLGAANVDDVQFISDLIDKSEKDLTIDAKRVYVVGHSNGAMMADLAGAKLSDKVAAIGVVAGTVGIERPELPKPSHPISVISLHSKADETVPFDKSSQGWLNCVSAPDSAKWWAEQDGCKAPTISRKANTSITDFADGKSGVEVELVAIDGGSHAWPTASGGAKVSATDLIWSFLSSHAKR